MAKYFDRDEFACQYTGNNEIEDKFIENGNKYPVELFKGSSKKYNHRNN